MGTHAVILAGGTGQRFWPLSRELSPKQLLSVFGTESLVAQAVRRVMPFIDGPDGSTLLVTNERLLDELRNTLSATSGGSLGEIDYVVEPLGKNTGPAIALAAALLMREDPDALMIVLPSDHLLDDGDVWRDAVSVALRLAADGYLVTFGIRPTRPETGYGYIEAGAELSGYATSLVSPRGVVSFVEKPDAATADSLIADGIHYWNAGIFVMGARQLLEELRRVGGAEGALIADTCEWVATQPRSEWTGDAVRDRFRKIPAGPVDKMVMERSSNIAVVPASLQWHDVGSFLSLESVAAVDAAGNARVGRGVDVESTGSLVYSADRLIATLGLKDTVVIDTADATLVCPKERCQDVRLVVDALRAMDAEEVVFPRTSLRPWGSWTSLLKGERFQIKLLEVKPKAKPSLQRHQHRSEHWVVVEGSATVTRDTDMIEVHANESVFLPVGCVHRVENRGRVPLRIIEVQVGEYLGEDDIIRLEDDWHREENGG